MGWIVYFGKKSNVFRKIGFCQTVYFIEKQASLLVFSG